MRKRKMRTLFMSMLTVLCSLFMVKAGQNCEVLAAENVFEMTRGGSIRIAEPYGLRFQVKMSADVKNKANKVGMLIFPADYLVDNGTDGDVYYESVEALANTNEAGHRIDLDLTSKLYEKDGCWYGNGAIVNIKEKNMAREFVGIAYYVDGDTTVWTDTAQLKNTTRSAAQVALLTHADKTNTFSEAVDSLLVNYIEYLKLPGVEDSAPNRYKIRGCAADNGLHIYAVQYVDQYVMGNGDYPWNDGTHLEAQIWQHNMGYGVGNGLNVDTYCAFFLNGRNYINNSTNTTIQYNYDIKDRGEYYQNGYRYEIRYEIFLQFPNNINSLDGPYAFIQFKHHMPGETREDFVGSYQEYRDNARYLWQENISSYEFRKTGIVNKVKERKLANVSYEGEHLECIAYQGRRISDQQLNGWSNGAHKLLLGEKVGDYMTLAVNVPQDGYYILSAKMTRASDFGYAQHYIDGVKLGNPINNLEGGLTVQPGVIGKTYLTAGRHELKAVMVGTESGANPGYLYGLDVLTLQEYTPFSDTNGKIYDGEELEVISTPSNIIPSNQYLFWTNASAWSQYSQLLVKFKEDNQSVSLAFEVDKDGTYTISTAIGKAADFGKVQFEVDGREIGTVIDGYDANLVNSGLITLGKLELTKGKHTLTVTCKGTNGSGRLFALDTLKVSQELPEKQKWDDDGVLKILNIGNSFSVDSQEYVYQIAQDLGVQNIKLGNLYIGGCSLETHLNNATNYSPAYTYYTNSKGVWETTDNYPMQSALASENWDYVVFQQVSGLSGVADTYDSLDKLIDVVEMYAPQAKYAWQMTWAYQQDSTHADFAKYNRDQMTMYNAIVSAVQSKIVNNSRIDYVIPVGTAVQNARTSYMGDTLTRDGFHLNFEFGRYLAGATVSHALIGKEVEGLHYKPSGVSEGMVDIVLESVANAITKPYEVTESQYNEFDYSDYKQLDLNFESSAYYNSSLSEDLTASQTDALCNQFFATKKFTKNELPIGTIIEIAEGYRYRPDAWPYNGSRPDNTSIKRIIVNESWWGNYTKKGFNISSVLGTNLLNLTEAQKAEIFKIYVPKEAYTELKLDFYSSSFYNSVDNTNYYALISGDNFFATKIFTKEELPVGTIIEIASGYKYRPDGWKNAARNASENRPANVETSRVVVDDAWWGDFTERGFNVSNIEGTNILSLSNEQRAEIFKIYVPKNAYQQAPEKEFHTNLAGGAAVGGQWTVTQRGLTATNAGLGDCWYMFDTSVKGKQSWIFEADMVVDQGGAGGLVFGVKNPTTPNEYWNCINSDKGAGEFKHFKGGSQQGWYKGISYGALANTNAYHMRVEYNVQNSLITYKIAPYGTENYVIVETQEDRELSAFEGDIYFGLVTCWATVTYDNIELRTADAISGKKIAWLGSSVTYGSATGGYSMADVIANEHVDTTCYKYAVSGTTLVNESSNSYVARMKQIDPDLELDMLVVQLSTNDATQGKALGTIGDSMDMDSFDTKTVAGAIEYIIAYAENTWHCPVVFYTGTYYDSAAYASMVELLLDIQEKWDIGVIDLWNDAEMTALYGTAQYAQYMSDSIHPTALGYKKWWAPKFEKYMLNYWGN